MRLKLSALFLAVMFIFAGQAAADDSDKVSGLFRQGNTYYNEEKFEKAIDSYEEALSLGLESGALYYNLGNAYFKQDYLGKAILNYLRAQRLMPDNVNLKSNLSYARSFTKDGKGMFARKWFVRIFLNMADSFTLDGITLLTAILYFSLAGLIIFAINARNLRKVLTYTIVPFAILLVVSASLFSVRFYKIICQKEAVVITRSSDSKFEPFKDATTFFTLTEGESIFVLGIKESWAKIQRVDGKRGWIKKEDIEVL